MRRTGTGFTLIELVMILVVLGILAALAIPRFVDLSDEAGQAVFEQVRSNFETALELVRTKSALNRNADGEFQDILLGNDCINVRPDNGYPTVNQSSGNCNAVAFIEPPVRPGGRPHRLSRLWGLVGIGSAHAIPPPPPPPASGRTLPELLISLDISDWTWTESGTTGTLTSPEGFSFVYNEVSGQVN